MKWSTVPVELEDMNAESIASLQDERDCHTKTVFRKNPVHDFLLRLLQATQHSLLFQHAEILAAENMKLRDLLAIALLPKASIHKRINRSMYGHWICYMPETELPRYKHDCASCTFLGLLFKEDGTFVADVYFHGYTVIFRVSDDAPDYWSMDFEGMTFVDGDSPSDFLKIGFAIYCAAYLP